MKTCDKKDSITYQTHPYDFGENVSSVKKILKEHYCQWQKSKSDDKKRKPPMENVCKVQATHKRMYLVRSESLLIISIPAGLREDFCCVSQKSFVFLFLF